jgi:TonB family protein
MIQGNIIVLIGVLLVAAGVLGGEALPWFNLKFSEIVLVGMEFNLGLVLLALCGVATLFTIATFAMRDRVYQISTTLTSILVMLGAGGYAFNAATILALPKAEVAILGQGLILILWGSLVMLVGTLVVFGSRVRFSRQEPLLRAAVILHGSVVEERYLVEQRDLVIGGKPRRSFFETGFFFILFAVCTGVLPALVFGPMIAEYAAHRRNRRHLHVPAGKFPEGQRMFLVGGRSGARVGLNNEMDGKLRLSGKEWSVPEYVRTQTPNASSLNYVPLAADDWGIVRLTPELSIFFQVTPIDQAIPRKSFWAFDRGVAGTTALSGVVQVALMMMAVFLWKEEPQKQKRQDVRKALRVDIMTKQEEKEEEELEELGEEEEEVGKKAEGEEGKFGDPDIDPSVESKVPKQDGKMVDKIDPKKVGLNDLLSSSKSNAIASILSTDTGGFSNKIAVAMSGTGSEFVLGHGSGGLGFKGTGTGGGGTGGFGRIHGLGEIDTGGGSGVSVGLGKKKAKKVGKLEIGSGSSQGFCQKNDIVTNVRRRAGAIRACYERELQVHANLQGKVTCRWTIGLNGDVTNATTVSSTLGNSAVENCLLRTVRRMRFAKPEGGVCVIQWPFVFNAGG